jgi:hypothetical protein
MDTKHGESLSSKDSRRIATCESCGETCGVATNSKTGKEYLCAIVRELTPDELFFCYSAWWIPHVCKPAKAA